ncbi:hypothetical protein BZG36_01130 [Bifiguratus adelaidae]|uniref:Uncharacterized protein n=1 Tax=Bifiguratus adelaidae TaxID=1938954 RepID=A0A261Y678_9FUNG|nr:hypothetical protein BZG36_01130 [Bifiguratus adelaidae]
MSHHLTMTPQLPSNISQYLPARKRSGLINVDPNAAQKTKAQDLAPVSVSRDAPRGFRDLMQLQTLAEKKQQQAKPKPKPSKQETKLEIRPGERMKDFHRRVDEEMKDRMLHSLQRSKTTSIRKKKNREQRKLKQKAKMMGDLEELEAKDFDQLQDKVKFGEVAQAPPTLTKIPRKIGGGQNKAALAALLAKGEKEKTEDGGNESSEDENMKEFKALNRRKLRNMDPAQKRVLEAQREKAVAFYRAQKAKRLTAAGKTPFGV